MGRTFRKNDRFKKDRRDKNLKKSKKFKEFQHGHVDHRPIAPTIEDTNYDSTSNDDNS